MMGAMSPGLKRHSVSLFEGVLATPLMLCTEPRGALQLIHEFWPCLQFSKTFEVGRTCTLL